MSEFANGFNGEIFKSEKVDYYKVGSSGNHVISNSSLTAINPEQGGSPTQFLSFFDNDVEKKKSKALYGGSLVHDYMEHRDTFIIAEIVEPTEMMSEWVKGLNVCLDRIKKKEIDISDVDISITSGLKTEGGASANRLAISTGFSDLANIIGVDTDTLIRAFRLSRGKAYSGTKDEAKIIEAFKKDGLPYFQFLQKTEGKTIMDKQTKFIVESIIRSLNSNKFIIKHLNWDNSHPNWKVFKEVEVYWTENGIKFKAKLDYLILDIENQRIYYYDHKTTKDSYFKFSETYEYYQYDRQHAFYKKAIRMFLDQNDFMKHFLKVELFFRNIVMETTNNFISGIYESRLKDLAVGKNKIDELLSRYKWHQNTGKWGYSREEYENEGILKIKNNVTT